MNRITLILSLVAAAAVGLSSVSAQNAEGDVPPGHPPVGMPPPALENPHGTSPPETTLEPESKGEPVIVPAADPADVESIDAIILAYYDSISGPKGEARDWDRFRSLFQPFAQLIAARPVAETGGARPWSFELEDFIGINSKYFEAGGYFEREIGRTTEQFGNIAHVWSTFESRQLEEAPTPNSRGINSFQLIKDGNRWRIVTVYWDHERMGSPIPEKYIGPAE